MPLPAFPLLGGGALDAIGAPALLLALRDDDVVVASANRWFAEASGRALAQLDGQPLHAALDPDTAAALARAAVRATETGEACEAELVVSGADGAPRVLQGTLRAFGGEAAGDVAWVTACFADVTALHAEAHRLRGMVRDLEDLVEHLPDAVARVDRHLEVRLANGAFARVTGQAHAAVPVPAPDGWPAEVASAWASVLRRVFDGGAEGAAELEVPTPGGVRTHAWRVVPERGRDGRVETVLAVGRDVTEQRRAMADRLAGERRLLEAQRIESLGVLAGGVAHDFNNMLAGIVGTASHARHVAGDAPQLDGLLARIETTGLRAADLCRQLLGYAGRGALEAELVDLGLLAAETLELLRSNVPSRVALELQAPDALPMVRGDATQLRQVLMNLVFNGAEAIGDRPGLVSVRLTTCRPAAGDWANAVVSPERVDGTFLTVEVTDDGCGMGTDLVRRIFDPFFTTRPEGRGLGLAVALGIVRAHGGALLVRSAPGEGTTFTLHLPAAQRVAAPASPRVAERWRGEGLVLIVDDEEVVRRAAALIARGAGLRTLFAADGPSAARLLTEHPELVDAVLLDMTMPGADGPEVLRELRAVRPHLPVVVTTGFSEHTVLQRLGGQPISAFVPKPFTKETLLSGLRRALGFRAAGAFLERHPL